MDLLANQFSDEFLSVLANSLIHSVWQISLIGFVLFMLLNVFVKTNSQLRYGLSYVAICLSLVVVVIGFANNIVSLQQMSEPSQVCVVSVDNPTQVNAIFPTEEFSAKSILNMHFFQDQKILGCLWLVGLFFLLLKFLAGIYYTKIIKSTSIRIEDERIADRFKSIKNRMGINKLVGLAESAQVTTAMVVGYWKPVVLFPICLISQLNTAELESVIAHELAHIKRNDFLFNLIQSIAEIILYYHPVIWWISSIINEEREICCDKIAVDTTKNSYAFASALVKLQDFQSNHRLPLAMSFSGNKNQFKNRIMKILNKPYPNQYNRERIFGIIALILFASAFKWVDQVKSDQDVVRVVECIEVDAQGTIINEEKLSGEITTVVLHEDLDIHSLEIQDVKEKQLLLPSKNAFLKGKKRRLFFKNSIDTFPEGILGNRIVIKDIDSLFGSAESKMVISNDSIVVLYQKALDAINLDSILKNLEHSKDIAKLHKNALKTFEKDQVLVLKDQYLDSKDKYDRLFDKDKFPFEHLESRIVIDELIGETQLFPEDIDVFVFPDEKAIVELNGKAELSKHLFPDDPLIMLDKTGIHPIKKRKLSDVIGAALLDDGYIESGDNFKLTISAKQLKINKEKQPKNILKKYKEIFEQELGFEINEKTKITVESTAEHSLF